MINYHHSCKIASITMVHKMVLLIAVVMIRSEKTSKNSCHLLLSPNGCCISGMIPVYSLVLLYDPRVQLLGE